MFCPHCGGVERIGKMQGKSRKPLGEKKGRGYHHRYKILALVDRSTGQARSIVVDHTTRARVILKRVEGKRLTYRRPDPQPSA